MSDLDREVKYTFTMVDNVSQTAQTMETSVGKANEKVKSATAEQNTLRREADMTTQAFTRQEAQFVKQVAVLMSVKAAVSSVTNGLITLGVVSGDDAVKLQKLNAAFQILTGFATGVKALQAVSEALKVSEMGLATIETFRAVMNSPWKAALVGVGVGAAGGAALAMMSNHSSTTNNTQIVVENVPAATQTATAISATISGGRVL